jgi:hypothetical protein
MVDDTGCAGLTFLPLCILVGPDPALPGSAGSENRLAEPLALAWAAWLRNEQPAAFFCEKGC